MTNGDLLLKNNDEISKDYNMSLDIYRYKMLSFYNEILKLQDNRPDFVIGCEKEDIIVTKSLNLIEKTIFNHLNKIYPNYK